MEIEFLHVLPPNTGRTYRFIRFMHQNFDCKKHRFLVTALPMVVLKNHTKLLEFSSDLLYLCGDQGTKKRRKGILELLKCSKHIIWHSFHNIGDDYIEILSKNDDLVAKSSWIENGIDVQPNAIKTEKERERWKTERRIKMKMKQIGTISPVNAAIVKKLYNRSSMQVYYPPAKKLLPQETPRRPDNHTDKRLIQLGMDARVYTHHDKLFELIRKYKKYTRNSVIILHRNTVLPEDYNVVNMPPKTISLAAGLNVPCVMSTQSIRNEKDYAKYYGCIDTMVLSPSVVLYPEYMLAPLFYGTNVIYIRNPELDKTFGKAAFHYHNIGVISPRRALIAMENGSNNIFDMYKPDALKVLWSNYFNKISEGDKK